MALATVLPELLVTGQRMSVDEFIRRWEQLPDLKRAELIEGVVHVASPLGEPHGSYTSQIIGWLTRYSNPTPGILTGNDVSFRIVPGSLPQPDAYLRILRECGGLSDRRGGLVEGPPELVIEVCDSSKARDLGPKLALYQRAGVPEYLTVEVDPFRVTWRALTADGRYEAIAPSPDGSLRSRIFPGLWLDVAALEHIQPLDPVLRKGMRTKAYRAFRDRLAAKLSNARA